MRRTVPILMLLTSLAWGQGGLVQIPWQVHPELGHAPSIQGKSYALRIMLASAPAYPGRSLNGSTDVIVAPGIGTALDISSGPVVVSLWWFANSLSTTQVLVAHSFAGSNSQMVIGLGTAAFSPNNSMGYTFGCCGAFGPVYGNCGTQVTGVWYQAVVFLYPASSSSELLLSQGGVSSCHVIVGGSATRAAGGANFTIGNQDVAHGGTNQPFNGIIGEVAVWTTTFTIEQITALATICPVGPSARRAGLPQPVGYFPLYGASGASVEPDLSGNANNGALSGTTRANHPPCTP